MKNVGFHRIILLFAVPGAALFARALPCSAREVLTPEVEPRSARGEFAPTKLWEFPTEEERSRGEGMFVGKAVVLADDIILLGEVMSHVPGGGPTRHEHYLIRLDARTGEETVRRKLEGHLIQNLQEAGGRLFVAYGHWVKDTDTGWSGKSDGIRCFDTKEFSELWSRKCEGDYSHFKATARRVMLRERKSVILLDAASGRKLWEARRQPESHFHFPVPPGNTAFVTSLPGELARLDVRTGERLWRTSLSTPARDEPGEEAPCYIEIHHADGPIVASVNSVGNSEFCAVDARTGARVWSLGVGRPVHRTVEVDSGRLYFAVPGEIRALDLKTGNKLWRTKADTGDYCWLVTSGERLFAGGKKMFYGFDAGTGRMLWQRRVWARSWREPVVRGGSLYVSTSDGKLTRLDARTGEKLWSYEQVNKPKIHAVANGRVYATFNALVCLDETKLVATKPDELPELRTRIWEIETGAPVLAADEEGGFLYVGSFGYEAYLERLAERYASVNMEIRTRLLGSVVHGGRIYTLDRHASPMCLDAETGEVLWRGVARAETFFLDAAPLALAGGTLCVIERRVTEHEGEIAEHHRLRMFDAGTGGDAGTIKLPGRCASIAAAGSRLTAAVSKDQKAVVTCFEVPSGRKLWEKTGSSYPELVTIAGPRVFAVLAGSFLVLDLRDGSELYELPYKGDSGLPDVPPVVSGHRVVIVDGLNVCCADVETGILRWEHDLEWSASSAPVVLNGRAFIGSYDGFVACIDIETGELLWEKDLKAPPGTLCRLDAGTGDLLWRIEGPPTRELLVSGEKVLAGSSFEGFLCAASGTGRTLWEDQVKEKDRIRGGGSRSAHGAVRPERERDPRHTKMLWAVRTDDYLSRAVVFEKRLFVRGKRLYCFDTETGRKLWESQLEIAVRGTGLWNPPAVTGGVVVLEYSRKELAGFDAATGAELWRRDLGGIRGPFAVHEGTIFVPDEDHRALRAVDIRTGALLWSCNNIGWTYSGPVALGGRVFTEGRGNTLLCLEPASGKEIWKAEDIDAQHLAADEKRLVGASRTSVRCFDPATGKVLWESSCGDNVNVGPILAAPGGRFVAAVTSVGATTEEFIAMAESGAPQTKLVCLDAREGHIVWETPRSYARHDDFMMSGGLVCVGKFRGEAHALDPATGEVVETMPRASNKPPIVTEEKVYLVAGGTLYCYARQRRHWLRTESSPPRVVTAFLDRRMKGRVP